MPERKTQLSPLVIGPGNALEMTGFSWRWCRDHWQARGLPFVGAGKKRGIPGHLFLAALEQQPALAPTVHDAPEQTATVVSASDAAAQVRALLGKRKKTG